MNKAIGLALLVAGIVAIIFGINASDSVSSDLSRTFTGSPTNKTLWLLIGGIVATVVGAGLTFTGRGKSNGLEGKTTSTPPRKGGRIDKNLAKANL